MDASMEEPFDVLIVGAGVVGCALARVLARYALRTGIIDREVDVGEGTSKANSAIVHTGFDAKPGTAEARLVARGSVLWAELAPALHLAYERIGALLVAVSPEQVMALDRLRANGLQNGVTGLDVLSREETLRLEPHLSPAACGALSVPGESLIDPFGAAIAQAEVAALNGVQFFLGEEVRAIDRGPVGHIVNTPARRLQTRWLIDAAGLGSDEVAHMLGRREVRVSPRKGEFIVFDKTARRLVRHILLPLPSRISKGVLIAPTVFGNVLLGPTAVDGTDKTDLAVTQDGLSMLLDAGGRMMPDLAAEPIVSTYAGLRAVGDLADYRLEVDPVRRIVLISGIRSTGLTSSPAIAEDVVYRVQEAGLALRPNAAYRPDRPAPSWRPGHLRPCLDGAKVSGAPRYGRIVCLCETVSEGEIVEALHRPVPARTLDGVKKRTWATAGRCQAYFCTAALLDILSREGHAAVGAVTKRGPESEITAGQIIPLERGGA